MVQGSRAAVTGTNHARLMVRFDGVTPGADDTDLNSPSNTKKPANTNITVHWAIATRQTVLTQSFSMGAGLWLFPDDQDGAGAGTGGFYLDLHTDTSTSFPSGANFVVQASGSAVIPAAQLVDCGSYKVVPVLHRILDADPPTTAKVSNNNDEFYLDADNNVAASAGATAAPALDTFTTGRVGWFRIGAKVQSLTSTRTANGGTSTANVWGHPNTVTLSGDIHDAGVKNPKALRVGVTATGASVSTTPVKFFSVTPASGTGAFGPTASFNVDTLFPNTAGGVNHRRRLHAGTGGQTPVEPDVIANNIPSGGFSSDRTWVYFDTPAAGLAKISSSDFGVENTTDINVSPNIKIFETTAKAIAGVRPHKTSGYTTRQEIFKRTGSVNTLNAIPYLQTVVTDEFNNSLSAVAMTANTKRTFDQVNENSNATLTTNTGANAGRLRWNYTIANTNPAFNRYVKPGATRQTGSHVASGPDNPASPPFTTTVGNSDFPADYPGPYPGYPRDVQIVSRAFGSNNPSVSDANVFGVNSEIHIEDMWTGFLSDAALNSNGVPTGPGTREQTLGAGSLKAKLTTLIDEGDVTVINVGEFNVKDVAGRNIDLAGAEEIKLRRAIYNETESTVEDAGTSLSDAQTALDTPLGYSDQGANSLDDINPPANPSSLIYYQGYSDDSTQRGTFTLTSDTDVGFTSDTFNFGYFAQPVSFIAVDLSIAVSLNPRVSQSDPGVTQRIGCQVFRVTADDDIAQVTPDSPPIYSVFGLSADGSQTILEKGIMNAIGGKPSDFYVDLVVPSGYDSIKVRAFAKVQGSRTPGGDAAQIQVGYTFDAVDFATGLPFK